MVRAFGYCNDTFETTAPGRLCRGRERWIEGLPDATPTTVYRTVVSGAVFSDDSARDARRGFGHAGVPAAKVLRAMFPKGNFIGWAEFGDPLALPTKMLLEEDYTRAWEGGVRQAPAVRWAAAIAEESLDAWIEGEAEGLACPQVDAIVITDNAKLHPELVDALYTLCAFGDPDDRPARLYNATALPDVLRHARAVILFHLDKHGRALSVYSAAPIEAGAGLAAAAKEAGCFPVPFAIPPMLARWDRALFELRLGWDSARDGEFPVPPAEDAGGRWSARRKRKDQQETEE